MNIETIHIIGAGLSGLSAAVSLAKSGRRIVIHEMSRYPGGRCRSFYDPALGMTIDNGNHLILSSNIYTRDYLNKINSEHLLPIPSEAKFVFFDIQSKSQWTLQINEGFFPWWFFLKDMRVPQTQTFDYFNLIFLIIKAYVIDKPVSQVFPLKDRLFQNLVNPVLLAALNTKLEEASSHLAGKILLKTLGKGGRACKPLIAKKGLNTVFIDPAIQFLKSKGVEIHFNNHLRSLNYQDQRVVNLTFDDKTENLKNRDIVILAVPSWVAKDLVPDLIVPTEFSPIINVHYKINVSKKLPPILAVINGNAEWIFCFSDRISVTISAADKLINEDRQQIASMIWDEINIIIGSNIALPPWQIVKEKRATFKAVSSQNSLRPYNQTSWKNLFLAGDWTQTGYPATIEGAILSGHKAAKLAL